MPLNHFMLPVSYLTGMMNDFSSFPEFQTERLLLRKLNDADAPQIYQLRSDADHNKYIDRPLASSLDDGLAFITRINKLIDNNESLLWAIQPITETTIAGTILLWHIDFKNRKAELGYELLPVFQGKGYLREALHQILSFSFSQLGLSVIGAWTHPENKRSISVLEKLGFTRDEEADKNKPADAIENIYRLDAANYSYK